MRWGNGFIHDGPLTAESIAKAVANVERQIVADADKPDEPMWFLSQPAFDSLCELVEFNRKQLERLNVEIPGAERECPRSVQK